MPRIDTLRRIVLTAPFASDQLIDAVDELQHLIADSEIGELLRRRDCAETKERISPAMEKEDEADEKKAEEERRRIRRLAYGQKSREFTRMPKSAA